jgi:hypothetical protein
MLPKLKNNRTPHPFSTQAYLIKIEVAPTSDFTSLYRLQKILTLLQSKSFTDSVLVSGIHSQTKQNKINTTMKDNALPLSLKCFIFIQGTTSEMRIHVGYLCKIGCQYQGRRYPSIREV